MHLRKLLAALGGLFVMSVSGIAISGGDQVLTGTALDFSQDEILWLQESTTGGRIGYFQHTIYTQHLPGNVDHAFPPSPCRGYVQAWNHLLITGAEGSDVGRMRFHNLIALIAQHQCTVTIDVAPSSDPAIPSGTIDTITPN